MSKNQLTWNTGAVILKRSFILFAIFLISFSSLAPSFRSGLTVQAMESKSAEEILSSLTEEQRNALKRLEVSQQEGLIGFQAGELEAEKETTVIVQLQSMPEKVAVLSAKVKGKKLSNQAAKKQIDREQGVLKKYVEEKKGNIEASYKTSFNGMAVALPANQIESLLKLDVVKAVYKSRTYSIEPNPNIMDEETEVNTPHMADSIPFLGIDRLHEEGITGKGIKVGVIDTGIDYTHPDLKDAFAGGYDVVDDDNDPMETTYEDWQASGRPLVSNFSFYYTSHGTHVSGTIAGQAKNTGGVSVKGVAPDVELYGYRVLGPYGSGQTEDVIAGIEHAVNDGMDVINLSLGVPVNEPFDPTSIAVNNAVLNGVIAVVSAGNNGSKNYSLGTPGAASLALTVGASSTSQPIVSFTGELNDNEQSIYLQEYVKDFVTDLSTFNGETLEVIDIGDGLASDYEGKDVEGKIAMVNHGVIGTQSKVIYAKEHGAKAVIVYYSDPEVQEVTAYAGEDHRFVPSFYMTNQDGMKVKDLIAKGKVSLTFSDYTVTNTKEDVVADFSSRGPSRANLDIKPEVTAPGVSILSTVPAYAVFNAASSDYQFAYDRYSGTSMASPHVAGIAALMLQENPELTPAEVKTALMNTAIPLNGDYSVFDVGAGRVDPYEAVHTKVKWSVVDTTPMIVDGEKINIEERTGGMSFGSYFPDEGTVHSQKTITVENQEKKKKQFNVEVEFTNASSDPKKSGIKVLTEDKIKLKPGETITTDVKLVVPETAEIGMFEGYVTFVDKKTNERYRVPFAFRTMADGFNVTDLTFPAISPTYLHPKRKYFANYYSDLIVNFKSPMKKIDFVLVNGTTSEELGFIGTLDLSSAYEGINYLVRQIFNGEYYAFTGDDTNSIESVPSKAKPGYYKIKLIGTSQRDLEFSHAIDVYIDPNDPTLTTDLDGMESPVIEYGSGESSYMINVEVNDPELKVMMDAGMDVDSSLHTIDYKIDGRYNPVIPVREDGTLPLQVPLDENNAFMKYSVYANDIAENHSQTKSFYFIQEGKPYGYIQAPNESMKTGESFNASLVLNYIDDMTSGEWMIQNFNKYFELVEAKPNTGLEANTTVHSEIQGNNLVITMDADSPMSGKINAIDLKIRVKDSSFVLAGNLSPKFTYTNNSGEENNIPHAEEEIQIVPTFSEIYGSIRSTAPGYYVDWTKVGARIKVIDQNGNEYDGSDSFDRYGYYAVSQLPITEDPLLLEVNVPGHFISKQTVQVGVVTDELAYGQLQYIPFIYLTPGDVNQDDVIDILDALSIQAHWGSNNRQADINFDGVVDSEDMNILITNYLKKNPDASDAPEPQSESNGTTLEDILAELGM